MATEQELQEREEQFYAQEELERERFLQAERIRRARDEEDVRAMQEEIIGQEKKQKGRSVGKVTFMMMVTVALTLDIILAIVSWFAVVAIGAIINWIISAVAFCTFYLWFKLKGIKFNSPKKMLALPGGFLIEMIPYLNMLPGWTMAVFMTTAADKIEKVVKNTIK